MATLAEKFDKIKSPKLQNQHHVSPPAMTARTLMHDNKKDWTKCADMQKTDLNL